ncbi:hypothetical protein [Lysobacter xanthus]
MDTPVLLLGVLLSSIGLGYCLYARRQRAGVPLACGVGLMIVPYLVSSVALLLLAGVVLAAIPWVLRR